MKDLRIDGRLQRVFVLTESDKRIVYIPVKHLSRVDYTRLNEIESKSKDGEMLEQMRKTRLDNGRNALALYDSIIQVMDKKSDRVGLRLPKAGEPASIANREKQIMVEDQAKHNVSQYTSQEQPDVVPEQPKVETEPAAAEETPKRRGRPPKPKED